MTTHDASDAAPRGISENVTPVFNIGMPRSGTTWMMWLLAQHPEIAVLRGSGLFMPLQILENWRRRGLRFTQRDTGEDRDGVYTMQTLAEAVPAGEFHEYCRAFCGRVFDAVVQGSPQARVLLDQDPEHIEFVPLIRDVLPNARFIHVVRDPRAVYCSIQAAVSSWAMADGFPSSPVHVARGWSRYAAMAREAASDNERFLVVQYERLKAHGAEELERIHRWLGLDTDRALCEAAIEACRIDRMRSKTTQPKNFYRKGSATGWREEISRSALRALEYVAGEEMERWGYTREHPRSHTKPLRVRLHEAVARLVENRGAAAAGSAQTPQATSAAGSAPKAPPKGRLPRPVARAVRKSLRTLQVMRSFDLVKLPEFPPVNPRD